VIAYVGDMRSRYPGADDEIDPGVAERVIGKALGRGSVGDITGPAIGRAERLLLPLLGHADRRASVQSPG
jgi:hypothetical protein